MKQGAVLAILCLCLTSVAHAQDGTTCATARPMITNFVTYTADTTTAPNWMTSFGPLVSPSNDLDYTFTHDGIKILQAITPMEANYAFAMYLIPDCNESGTEPVPIGATATLGSPIAPYEAGVLVGHTYYLAITGTAAGGPGANGTLTFGDSWIPVTLQSFDID